MTDAAQSLLSWERGLKFDEKNNEAKTCESLLSWERGLKYLAHFEPHYYQLSLLSWERGLKCNIIVTKRNV